MSMMTLPEARPAASDVDPTAWLEPAAWRFAGQTIRYPEHDRLLADERRDAQADRLLADLYRYSPDKVWFQRHWHLLLAGYIHDDLLIGCQYLVILAKARLQFLCRSKRNGAPLADEYRAYRSEVRQ